MITKKSMNFASRWMLPLEIWMAPLLFTAGLSCGGYLGRGRLYDAAVEYSSPEWCFFFLVLVAAIKISVAGYEFVFGRRWIPAKLFVSVSARCFLSFISFSLWVYLSYLLWSTPSGGSASPFILLAPWCALGNVVVFYQNYMVRCLLNPAVPTFGLECKLLAQRKGILH